MDVDAALQSQIRNIETTYGKPLDHWFAVIDASGLTKHNQVVAMLKADHGLAHGAAHRISLLARQRDDAGAAAPPDPAGASMLARRPDSGRCEDAAAAYRDALALEPAEPVRRHITGQIAALGAAHAPTEET